MALALYNERIPLQRQVFVLEGKILTEFPRPYSWQRESLGGWSTCSPYAWVCPKCLRVWAIAFIEGRGDELMEVTSALCEEHGGGSLLEVWRDEFRDPALLDYATPEFIQREFNLAIKGVV